MSLLLFALIAIYVSGILFTLGFGYADQHTCCNPDYVLVFLVSLLWPVFVGIWFFNVKVRETVAEWGGGE